MHATTHPADQPPLGFRSARRRRVVRQSSYNLVRYEAMVMSSGQLGLLSRFQGSGRSGWKKVTVLPERGRLADRASGRRGEAQLVDAVNGDDVRMGQSRRHARLAHESVARLVVGGKLRRQELDGYRRSSLTSGARYRRLAPQFVISLPVPTLWRFRRSNPVRPGQPFRWEGCNRATARCVRTTSRHRSLETRNVVFQAPLLVEYASAHAASAHLRGVRHARRRAQGLVLHPPWAGGDGPTQG